MQSCLNELTDTSESTTDFLTRYRNCVTIRRGPPVDFVWYQRRLLDDDTWPREKSDTARAWVYVRDNVPFGGPDLQAALFRYSQDCSGDHPLEHLCGFAGILPADAYAGYNRLHEPDRSPAPVAEALCCSRGRRIPLHSPDELEHWLQSQLPKVSAKTRPGCGDRSGGDARSSGSGRVKWPGRTRVAETAVSC